MACICRCQNEPAMADMHGPRSDSVIMSASVRFGNKAYFGFFFGNCATLAVTNADQWKPDYRVVTNENPRNKELFGADQ